MHIVPINNKYPLKELISSCKTYLKSFTNKKNITIEYILIKEVNDSLEHAKELSKILNHLNCKINLIPFNPFDGCDYERSSDQDINAFKSFLMKKGFIATVRRTRGDLIDGACGQLVGNLNKATKGKKLIKHKQII
jgi:23S rRNA (adenine2503-C2)-methyltransferase